MQPQIGNEDITGSLQYNLPTQQPTSIVTTRSGFRWLILDSSRCIGDIVHELYGTSLI